MEQLESRTLLTGNVTVSLQGANAQLTGDSAGNDVEIVVDNGSVVVRGLNGTTINNGTTAFSLVPNGTTLAGRLDGALGAGDDIVTIGSGITFNRDVSLVVDDGADTLRVRGGVFRSNVNIRGGDAANSVLIDNTTIDGNLAIFSRGEIVASLSSSTIHGDLFVLTGRGADSIVLQGVTIDRVTTFLTGRGDDDIVLQNSTLGGPLLILSGKGNDFVYVNSSSIAKLAVIATQRGNDTLQVLGGSSFGELLVFDGGSGKDVANVGSDTTTHGVIRVSQKSKYFDPALVASRITNSTTGAIAKANSLLTAATPTLALTTNVATISESAGATAATLTVTRTGSTFAALEVTLASSNTSKATVPATVTIPAGSTSITANIAAVNNPIADSDAVVTITATATGLVTGTRTLTVTNDDSAALTLTASQTTVAESAGASAVTYTVARNSADVTQPLTVNLASSASGRLSVGSSVIIPANAASVTFVGAAVENAIVDGNASVTVTANATGFTSGTVAVMVTENDVAALTVTPATSTVAENVAAGTATYTLARNTSDTTQALIVNLSSANTVRLGVPSTVTIPVGSASATFTVTPVNNTAVDGNVDVQLTASAAGFVSATWTVTVTNDDTIALTATATATDAVQSNNTIITRNSAVQVSGASVAGATISVDSDGDGQFNNGTTVAGLDGSYSLNVPILNTATNHGENQLVVRAVSGTDMVDQSVRAHRAVGTVVHFATNKGSYDVELLDTAAPVTVANFLGYVNSGAYQNLIIHRTGPQSFIQGGGFKLLNGVISSVTTTGSIQNEFNAANSNVSGTLAMALLGDGSGGTQPNSGTSGWFVNTTNNSDLDSGRYTVFGRVIGDGVLVARAISGLTTHNLNSLYSSSALATVPLSAFNPANTQISGTVAMVAGSPQITGTGTLFTSQLTVGQSIRIASPGASFVASIASDTSLTLTTNAPGTAELLTVLKDVVPQNSDFVVFSSIGKILDTI